MNQDNVNEYIERCEKLIETSPQMDEQNTKVRLVQPFLELLGWDLYSTEVELEYTIPMASGSTHVDYALLVGDSPVVFVEAKPVRSKLTNKDIQQLKSYMRQELDVDWGILTNGKTFEVLTKSDYQNGGAEVSVVQFDLDDLAENPNVLELLSKESIRSGRADEIAEQVAQTNEVIQSLQENEDSVTDAVKGSVESEVGELTIDLEEQAREFVQSLVTVLHEQRQFFGEESPLKSNETRKETQDISSDSDVARTLASSSSNDRRESRETQGHVIRFSDKQKIPEEGHEIHTKQNQNMGVAIDYLIQEHNLINKINIPHSPPRARKNCSINSEPVHPNGEEMRSPYELSNGYYLHTSLNTQGKKNRVRDLAEKVGLSAEFLGQW